MSAGFGGGFGQPAATGFGQQPTGGFGQAPQGGAFGQVAPAATGFGQPSQSAVTGGFGQTNTGGFGQPAATGFGQPAQSAVTGGFGQTNTGGFGQPAATGFGQPAQSAVTGGFGQTNTGGFGQPAQGGFGQTAAAANAFGQAGPSGGFGQTNTGGFGQQSNSGFGQAGRGATAGFGQPGTGFGQPATGGFGQATSASPFGQAAAGRGVGGGFGTAAGTVGGFGQPAAAGGFGQTATTGGFGQPAQGAAAGGFGQPATGGFGQATSASPFGQAAAGRGVGGGFGTAAGTVGGFGQPAATGGFGQTATAGGFGQPARGAAAGGFGQPATGGFGQATSASPFGQAAAGRGVGGGFGTAAGTVGGFGQPAATGGFGQTATAGGFGQPAQGANTFGQGTPSAGGFGQAGRGVTGGFGQTGVTGGFGQTATTGGFGQPAQGAATGGFGQAGRGAADGFGRPAQGAAAGGFGQPATGGFGQATSASPFGQAAAGRGVGGGFGTAAGTVGGFGQPAATGGFGQTATAGGFGQPARGAAAGGFGQPATGGLGLAGGSGFGAAAGAGGFGQQSTASPWGGGATPAAPVDVSLLNLPEFADKPYGNVLLFAPEKPPKKPISVGHTPSPAAPFNPISVPRYQQRIPVGIPAPTVSANVKLQPTPFSTSALSSVELRELLNASKVNLGVSDDVQKIDSPKVSRVVAAGEKPPSHDAAVFAPVCSKEEYILDPPLATLQGLAVRQLQEVYGFSVYRRDGKCSVHFLEPVNLVRCDIAEIVELRPSGEVKLYPCVQNPPSIGQGLNVKARVTVNGVIGTTSNDLLIRCQKEGNRFESYDVNTGTWVYVMNVGDDGQNEYDDADREVDIVETDTQVQDGEQFPVANDIADGGVRAISQLDTCAQLKRSDPPSPPFLQQQQQVPVLHQNEAVSALSFSRYAPFDDQSLILPQRTQRVSVLRQAVHRPAADTTSGISDFELPYTLPSPKKTPLCERKGPLVVKEPYAKAHGPVYVVKREDSKMYEMNASVVSRGAMASLSRSFRCGWCTGGRLVAPMFAWVRDGTESRHSVDEVLGSRVVMSTVYFAHATSKHYLQSCAISVLRALCRHAHRVDASSDKEGFFPLLELGLCRDTGSTSLSTEKLREVIAAVDAVRFDGASAVGESTARQAKTILSLLDALYGLPDADEADKNAITERRYLTQLRRRNLNSWLKTELEYMDLWTDLDVDANPSQKLLRKLLCGKLREASSVAKALGSTELSRVVGICGEGNHFGSYVQTSDNSCIDEALGIRERVVSLLSGIVEPFVSQPQYAWAEDEKGGRTVAKVPLAATWKQLLGVFAFYGCTPDSSAEETIDCFLKRLRAPTSRRENSFPPYAERISADKLGTGRGRSFVSLGEWFPDAALSLLEGFAMGVAPAATALHPHSSSYCATDYLTPFIIIVSVRALKLQRTDTYDDAETKALLGFAAALECLSDAWFWALLPLHMIVDDKCRAVAVEQCLRRNAHRFQGGACRTNTDYVHLAELLKINARLLDVEMLLEKVPADAPVNAPSIRTHSSLQEALHRFSRGFTKR
ncbi:nucleoporin, putative2 [Trypanosoma brucei gambiense DAL972]|uniref:Nucleoporin, putative2 n=1 Tax=Trypanosoma brucei gambiense (strain MHOM/CI/86/DAL972) TaxID=679716 RepID=D0A5N8_TRYB9|nr:nucleoporin, putative2 [Trypanosoma brucei gambiense DAL972]CBH16989.1 nucleoporin, putative2 [Trypanosoma brucei gambiense DAL972]|eukprot:XP_011779253.1 nucleoporin, putative2 [Trypanosoma brucei gambiense DAL972]